MRKSIAAIAIFLSSYSSLSQAAVSFACFDSFSDRQAESFSEFWINSKIAHPVKTAPYSSSYMSRSQLYDSIRPRLEQRLDPEFVRDVFQEHRMFGTNATRGKWYEFRRTEGGRHFQAERFRSSSTISKGDEKALMSFLKADELVTIWAKAHSPLTIDKIKLINKVVDESREVFDIDKEPELKANFFAMWQVNTRPPDVASGEFRKIDLSPVGANESDRYAREYIDAADIPRAMEDFIEWYNLNKDELHPVALASMAYSWIVSIHPFGNGNGRTGRFVMDWILMENGYPPVLMDPNHNDPALFGRITPKLSGTEKAFYFTQLGVDNAALVMRREMYEESQKAKAAAKQELQK